MLKILIAAVLALGALSAGLGIVVKSKTAEEKGLRSALGGFEACHTALTGTDLTASSSKCKPPIAAVHAAARRAEVCDQALLNADLFTIRTSCSTEVMTLLAQRDAETHRADRQTSALAAERADRGAAISRAEARVRTETERKARAEAVIQDAPRNGDGLVVLDAQRLCELRSATAACAPRP